MTKNVDDTRQIIIMFLVQLIYHALGTEDAILGAELYP